MNANQRTALYAVAVAAGGVALVYGLLSSDEVDAWLRVIEAALTAVTVIAPAVAIKHVTPDPPKEDAGLSVVTSDNPEQ